MQYLINNKQFDLDKRLLQIDKISVDCSARVLLALNLFLRSDNTTITKDQLITHIWGDIMVSDDSLFKVIQGLRLLLKQHGLSDILVNVYGKGYKIEPIISVIKPEHIKENTQSVLSKNNQKKRSIKIIIVVVFLAAISFLISQSKNANTISKQNYLQTIENIKLSPKKYLNSVESDFNETKLSIHDKIYLNSLKGFAHFNLGQYKHTLKKFNNAINLSKGESLLPIADNYIYMAKIYLYKDDEKKLLKYATKAQEMYTKLDNNYGMMMSQIMFIEYSYLTHNYQQVIKNSKSLFVQAQKEKITFFQIRTLIQLYHAYKAINSTIEAQRSIKEALEIASNTHNSKFISYCSGNMANDSMNEGDFKIAMKWVNLTLSHAVEQPSTNNFQQGFSYFYNILSPLGHNDLAEKYLQKAIEIQAFLNDEGHLHEAELNLAILNIKLGKYQQAKALFSDLLSYNLATLDRLKTKAWIAVNQSKLLDNITAYSLAKEVFYDKNSNNKIKFTAGIAFVQSAFALERFDEAHLIYQKTSQLANDNWLIEYLFYLDMAVEKSMREDSREIKKFQDLQLKFHEKLKKIKSQTPPNKNTLMRLDQYIEGILST